MTGMADAFPFARSFYGILFDFGVFDYVNHEPFNFSIRGDANHVHYFNVSQININIIFYNTIYIVSKECFVIMGNILYHQ